MLDQTVALERLVDDLRTVALADAGALALARKPTDLGALIDEQLEAFRASAPELTLTTEIEPGLPLVDLDAGRIAQVIRNLLSNAIRHTPAGGRVVVSARVLGSTVAVEVRDSGSGIAPELLPRVFDRFVKGSGPSGSGLGLAIAHDLVVAHGGTISRRKHARSGHDDSVHAADRVAPVAAGGRLRRVPGPPKGLGPVRRRPTCPASGRCREACRRSGP